MGWLTPLDLVHPIDKAYTEAAIKMLSTLVIVIFFWSGKGNWQSCFWRCHQRF